MSGNVGPAVACLLAFALLAGSGDEARADTGVEAAGDVLMIALPVASAGASLVRADGEGFLRFAGSASLALGVAYGLKYAVDSERPNGGDHSFPSGHATLSFCSAEFLRKRYGWAWGAPAYAVAGFVGYSRVEAREHHSSDVVAGALIGVASAWALTRSYEHVSVDLKLSGGSCGLAVAYTW